MMMSSSAALSQITTSMLALQSSTKSFLEKNSLESKPAKLKEYPALADLLGKAQSEITNPMALKDFTKTEKQRTKKPKDPNAPKRPQTAFFLYLNATKPEIKKDHPDLSAGPIAKLATERWNVASEEVKQVKQTTILFHISRQANTIPGIQRHLHRELQKVLHCHRQAHDQFST